MQPLKRERGSIYGEGKDTQNILVDKKQGTEQYIWYDLICTVYICIYIHTHMLLHTCTHIHTLACTLLEGHYKTANGYKRGRSSKGKVN